MDDIYMNMLFEVTEKTGIALEKLCHGICTREMLYMVRKGKKTVDRVSVKRLLARIGIDNADYASFIEYPEYEIWRKRMEIINAIEEDRVVDAKNALAGYMEGQQNSTNKSRDRLERQFVIYMKLQIMRHNSETSDLQSMCDMYEEAIKLTVPTIDEQQIYNILMSPVEFAIAVEYKSMSNKCSSINELIKVYRQWFDYIDNSQYGKLAKMKVYPKVVLCMYNELKELIRQSDKKDVQKAYKIIAKYSENAIDFLAQRKFLYYETEMLEISIEMQQKIILNIKDISVVKKNEELIHKRQNQLMVLKEMYRKHNINPYMQDDCYLYRESGVYCISEVLKIRREMMGITQNDLCGGVCDKRTLIRSEKKKGTLQKTIYKELFYKLKLFPEYINMGIVTENKEEMELYEELRYASNSFKLDEAKKLIGKLRSRLSQHPINMQMLDVEDSSNQWKRGEITAEEHIGNLKKSLEYTVNMAHIYKVDKDIFLTTNELSTFYKISMVYKKQGKLNKAFEYIEALWNYCKKIEENGLVDGRMGIYETVMTYIASLLGDMGRYEESNDISKKLIHICLKIKRNGIIHHNIYNIAWNKYECEKAMLNYNEELYRCINICQLTNDNNDELFYQDSIIQH